MRYSLLLTALFAIGLAAGPLTSTATACPMCKTANESDSPTGEKNTKPQAFMYSILFMLTMPATLLGTYGFTFWRMSRQSHHANGMPEADGHGPQPGEPGE